MCAFLRLNDVLKSRNFRELSFSFGRIVCFQWKAPIQSNLSEFPQLAHSHILKQLFFIYDLNVLGTATRIELWFQW